MQEALKGENGLDTFSLKVNSARPNMAHTAFSMNTTEADNDQRSEVSR